MEDFFEKLREAAIIGEEDSDAVSSAGSEEIEEGRGESGTLVLGDVKIHSIKELRSSIGRMYDVSALKKAAEDGLLYLWLSGHYYEEEAEKIEYLETSDKHWLRDLTRALGVPYNPLLGEVHHEDNAYRKRQEAVMELAGEDRESVPDNVNLVALNQEELAALLDAGQETIYLCRGEFNIPIGRKGVTYRGIARPTIENAFTRDLYEKAGVRVVDIELPEKVEEAREKYAMEKAVENGYDTFYDEHTPLACKLYSHLHGLTYSKHYCLPNNGRTIFEEYHSESAARQAVRDALRKTYDAASALFDKNDEKCAVKDIVIFYTKSLQRYYGSIKDILKEFCEHGGHTDELTKIEKIVGSCSSYLKKELYEELEDSSDYYEMYDFDYFVDQVDLMEFDLSIETDLLLSILENIFTETKTYNISNIFDAYMEIEKDANDKADFLHNAAREKFNELVAGLAGVFEELGKDLPPSENDETIGDYLKRVMKKAA